MHGAPNGLRVSWQFYSLSISGQEQYDASNRRMFELDQRYFDHYNMVPSTVSPYDGVALCVAHVMLIPMSVYAICDGRSQGKQLNDWDFLSLKSPDHLCL